MPTGEGGLIYTASRNAVDWQPSGTCLLRDADSKKLNKLIVLLICIRMFLSGDTSPALLGEVADPQSNLILKLVLVIVTSWSLETILPNMREENDLVEDEKCNKTILAKDNLASKDKILHITNSHCN